MNYTEFSDYIKKCFRELMGNDVRINIITIIGNNDCEREALIILEKDNTMSPSIYLKEYYEDYMNGVPMGEIIAYIYGVYKRYRIQNDINADFFYNYEKIKKSIVYKLVNKEKNKKMLQDIPHYDVLDLSVVFYFIINTESVQNATAMINNEHLKMWNVSRDEIFKIAEENTPRLLAYDIKSIDEILKKHFEQCRGFDEYISDNGAMHMEKMSLSQTDVKMFVLTNIFQMNGAACMLYEKPVRWFSEKINSDIYIIPSSIHEVIMLPVNDIGKDELNVMVEQVNREELAECDILSDHVYLYDRKKDPIIIP